MTTPTTPETPPSRKYRGTRPGPDWGPDPSSKPDVGKDWVAITLAIGMALAVNLFVVGVWVADIKQNRALSAQATQVLTTAFGGMIGILGGYLGYRAGTASEKRREAIREEARAEGFAEAEERQP